MRHTCESLQWLLLLWHLRVDTALVVLHCWLMLPSGSSIITVALTGLANLVCHGKFEVRFRFGLVRMVVLKKELQSQKCL